MIDKHETESRLVVSDSLWPHGILQARILERVASLFSRGSSWPRDGTWVSHVAGGLFTSWATREAQEYWSGWPIPSSEGLPDPGIQQGSPALQADSWPTELSGNPRSPVGVSISSRSHGRWGKTREVPDCIFCVCVRMIPPCFTISQSQTRKWLNTLLTLKPSSSLLPFLKFPGSISHFLCCASPVLYGNI